MGKFEIKKDKLGLFRFNLKAGNGQVILRSRPYSSKSACENGIESVRKHSYYDKYFVRQKAKDGSPYFELKASNGHLIGTSEYYSGNSGMENGIASVQKNAPDAEVVDLTDQRTEVLKIEASWGTQSVIVDTPDQVKCFIEQEVENMEEGDYLTITKTLMTEKELTNLVEFDGF